MRVGAKRQASGRGVKRAVVEAELLGDHRPGSRRPTRREAAADNGLRSEGDSLFDHHSRRVLGNGLIEGLFFDLGNYRRSDRRNHRPMRRQKHCGQASFDRKALGIGRA